MSKIFSKESCSQKIPQSNKDAYEEKIRSCVMSLIKKETSIPTNNAYNASVSFTTFSAVQVNALASALKFFLEDPGNRDEFSR